MKRSVGTTIGLLLIGATAVTGCGNSSKASGSSSKDNGAPTTTIAAASAHSSGQKSTSETLPPGVVGDSSVPVNVVNDISLRHQVVLSTCQAAPGGWGASGKATNSTSHDENLTITVFFTDTGGTVIATGAQTLAVGQGATVPWSVNATFTAPKQTLCVLRGVG